MNAVLALLGEVTAVFAVALLGARLASRARAAVRHLILASAFGVALVLPLATLVSPTITVEIAALPAREPEPVVADAVVLPATAPVEVERPDIETIPFATTPPTSVPARSIPVTTWLLLVWAAIALITLVPVGASLSHLRSIRRRGHPWPEGTARLSDLARGTGVRPPLVLLHDGIAAPITGGLVRPVIALPSDAVTWSETHVTNALIHELEHVRRRDWPVHLASRTVCALYWFHPLAWITWRALQLEAEQACDDAVLAHDDAAAYAEQLLELARCMVHRPGHPGLPRLSMASSGDLSSRIKAVLDDARPRGRAGKMLIACVAITASLAITALAPLRAAGPPRVSEIGEHSYLGERRVLGVTKGPGVDAKPDPDPELSPDTARSLLAGPSGQQISILTTGAEFEWVRVTGANQHDRQVTWDSSRFGLVCIADRCGEARTRDWWFKGKVTVQYRLRGEQATLYCHASVNERQSDAQWFNLLAPGRQVVAAESVDDGTHPAERCQTGSPAALLPAVQVTTEHYAGYRAGMPLPRRFASRTAATTAGCRFGNVKGPDVDTCVLGAYGGSTLNLFVYERSQDGSYGVANELAIPSQYYDSTLTLVDMLGQRTDWLVIETTGMHGTGIGQRVLFVLAWDGSQFRAVAAESLDYRCARPPAPADYALQVQHAFRSLGGAPGMVLDYQLTKDGQLIGKWSQQLRWSAYGFRFMPYQSKVEVQREPVIRHVLAQIEHVRVYSDSGPMNPANNAARWMERSELMDILAPACSPSLLYLAREFAGKWGLDTKRNAEVHSDPPTDVAPVFWTDREGLHTNRSGIRADGTYYPIEVLYRLDGKEFPLAVRLTGGTETTGTATAVLDGQRMVVIIRVEGWSQPLRRVIYREGPNLVIEESGGAAGTKSVIYYWKT